MRQVEYAKKKGKYKEGMVIILLYPKHQCIDSKDTKISTKTLASLKDRPHVVPHELYLFYIFVVNFS